MFVFAVVIYFLFCQVHEVTHYQIGKYFGCNGEIRWDFLDANKSFTELLNGQQTAFMSTHWDSNCIQSETQMLAHSINEIIGYNVMPVLELILILFFTFAIMNTKPEEKQIKIKAVNIK